MLKVLDKFVQEPEDEQEQAENPKMQELIQKCKGLPFYRWYKKSGRVAHSSSQFVAWQPTKHNDYRYSCCVNHVLGLPTKNGIVHPLYDYERILFDALEIPNYLNSAPGARRKVDRSKAIPTDSEPLYPQKVGHLVVLKSTGIGATEFFCRYIIWKCMVNDDLKGSDVCIITGPREQISIDILDRVRKLFLPLGITFDTKQTTLFINGVRIRSYPSNRLQDMRGLANVSIIYCDEAAFFDRESQSQVLDVCERYAGKSNAKIIFCSTPNKVGDLMHQIITQPFEKSFYKVIKLDYTYSLGKLYSEEDIKIAKSSLSFEREYNLSFSSGSGNVFGQ